MATSAASSARWQRSGEPGSAFSGLSKGRGSRGRGTYRGGRGSSRTNPREQTTDDPVQTSKATSPAQAPQPTTQPTQQAVVDKPPVPLATRSKAKPPRKSPRGDPSPHQAPGNQPTPAPSSTKPPDRRRRSHLSKTNENDPKISPSASTDSQQLAVSAASTLTKDPPPHLQRRDVRHDIDALVERVRAVAMDNRPATPGSHIDWAGDDDDSLPDLNDWGVTTSTIAPGESETISPIILEGLKPLPDVSAPVAASPLRQVMTLDNPATGNVDVVKNDTSPSLCEESTLTPDEDHEVTVSNTPLASKNLDPASQPKIESPEKQPLPPKPTPYPSNRKPWHPSLPAKPPTGSLVPRVNLRPVATPMRHPVHTKSSTHKEASKETQSSSEQVAPEGTSSTSPIPVDVSSATIKPGDEKLPATPSTTEDNGGTELASNIQPATSNSATQKDSSDDDSKREGLEASIHAPKTPAESIPPQMTTPRNVWSQRKEASQRHPPLSRNPKGDRLKQWNDRSGFQSGLSPRNQSSSNGASSPNSYHRIHASRPIITGDAMSRLVRTIGQTNSAS